MTIQTSQNKREKSLEDSQGSPRVKGRGLTGFRVARHGGHRLQNRETETELNRCVRTMLFRMNT